MITNGTGIREIIRNPFQPGATYFAVIKIHRSKLIFIFNYPVSDRIHMRLAF